MNQTTVSECRENRSWIEGRVNAYLKLGDEYHLIDRIAHDPNTDKFHVYCESANGIKEYKRSHSDPVYIAPIETSEPLATLYMRRAGSCYRFKAFTNMLMIERQPDGENIPFPREGVADAVYDDDLSAWDYEAIGTLIATYESDTR